MDIGSILLGLALLLVVAFVVLRPMLARPALPDPDEDSVNQLLLHREQALTQLRDLDFDHATGKFNEDDYAVQRALLVAEGVTALKALDAHGSAPAAPELDEIEAAVAQSRARRAALSPEDKLEASPGARRAASAALLICPECSTAVLLGDRFCPKCGTPLTSVAHRGGPAKAADRR